MKKKIRKIGMLSSIALMICLGAVSYTHLNATCCGSILWFISRRSFGIVTQKQIRLSTNCYHSAICGYYDSGIVHISCSVQFRYNVTHCGS